MAKTVEFTEDNFESEVLKSEQPVVVDFWADWCMPCKTLAPIINELAADFAGKAKVGKVNTESCRDISVKYNIQSIPTVLIFKGGEVVDKFVGFTAKKKLAAAIDKEMS